MGWEGFLDFYRLVWGLARLGWLRYGLWNDLGMCRGWARVGEDCVRVVSELGWVWVWLGFGLGFGSGSG